MMFCLFNCIRVHQQFTMEPASLCQTLSMNINYGSQKRENMWISVGEFSWSHKTYWRRMVGNTVSSYLYAASWSILWDQVNILFHLSWITKKP